MQRVQFNEVITALRKIKSRLNFSGNNKKVDGRSNSVNKQSSELRPWDELLCLTSGMKYVQSFSIISKTNEVIFSFLPMRKNFIVHEIALPKQYKLRMKVINSTRRQRQNHMRKKSINGMFLWLEHREIYIFSSPIKNIFASFLFLFYFLEVLFILI